MKARRYEMGRLVANTASTPKPGWGKQDAESIPAVPASKPPAYAATPDTPEEASLRVAPAKVVRRPPPVVVPESAPVEALPVAPTEIAPPAPPPPASQNADEEITDTSNMRKFLLKQMVRAAKGEITTETVKNIVAISQQVYNATSLELKAAMILKAGDKSIRALELVSAQDADE